MSDRIGLTVCRYFYAPVSVRTSTKRSKTHMERKLAIYKVFRKWIQFGEVKEKPELVKLFKQFIETLNNSPNKVEKKFASQLRDALGVPSEKEPSPTVNRKAPRMVGGILSAFKRSKTFSVCDVEPIEIAKHLTAVDWKYFKRIKTKELIKKGIYTV